MMTYLSLETVLQGMSCAGFEHNGRLLHYLIACSQA